MRTIPTLTVAATYETQGDLRRLPPYLGDLWRRSFGAALHRAVCVSPGGSCETCPVMECPFDQLFNHSRTTVRGEPSPWRPLVIHSKWAQSLALREEVGILGFSLTLFHRALVEHPSFLEDSLQLLGEQGLGARRTPLTLKSIHVLDPAGRIIGGLDELKSPTGRLDSAVVPWPPGPSPNGETRRSVEVRFLSPTRLERSGRPLDVELPLSDLVDFVLFRWRHSTRDSGTRESRTFVFPSLLALGFGGSSDFSMESSETMNFPDLRRIVRKAAQTAYRVEERLRWVTYRSYSSRRARPQSLSGLIGTVRYADVPMSLIDLLHFGVLTHVGKSCVAGNGAYEIRVDGVRWKPPFWTP